MKRILSFLFVAVLAGQAWAATTFTIGKLKYTVTDETNHYVSVGKGSTLPFGAIDLEPKVTNTNDGIEYTVTSIGSEAFRGCSGLTSVTIPNSVTSIGICAFYGCSSLAFVTIPNTVTSIGNSAFYGCSRLTSVTIPNSVTSIGEWAFYGCGWLTSVTIPNSVTSIGIGAFDGCSGLTSVTIPNSVTCIGNYAFYDCRSLTSVTIPNSLTSIGDYTFFGCSGLTSVTIPNSVTSIGGSAFSYCSGLTSVTIPNSVTSIGERAFEGCFGLTSVTIPNSVTSIGSYVFFDCSGLTEINVENGNTAYASENGVLFNKDKTNLICYPAGKTETTYTISNSITSIASYAFSYCSGLTSVTISNSITSIGVEAFYYCSSLASVTIPNSVTSIGNSAFYGCRSLTSVTIPNSVTSIGSGAFYNCSGLTSVTIPNSVTSISSSAFSDCSGLTSVTIPNSVTSIGSYAFYGCSGLTSVTIPNSVTSIGNSAFRGCSGLTSITIPNSVTSIDKYTFYGCSGLTAICYEGRSEPTYQSNSFSNVNKTIPVCVPEDYTTDTWCGFSNICIGHDKVTDNAVAATCTETGLTEGAHCSKCGKIFTAQEEIPALGHDYGEATYVWAEDGSSCTATAVCQRNENHIVTENATITSEVTIASTCEGMGTTTYTAKFTDSKFSKQTKDVVDIPALGHDYGEATYVWAEDGSSCTATTVCKHDENHIVTENATITSEVTIAATCEGMGTTTYTAKFTDSKFAAQTKAVVDVAANGHKADSVEFENKVAATCTAVGSYDSVVYCSVCQMELSSEKKEVAALAHTYSNAVIAPTCTAVGFTTHTCSVCNDTYNSDTVPANGHTEAIDATIAATCTAPGKTEGKHCSVCNEIIVAQEAIPALGHEFKTYVYNNDATTEADGTETAKCEHGCGAKDTRTAEGTKIATTPENGTAVGDESACSLNIYAQINIIVVENADSEIFVYDSMGRLICRDAKPSARNELMVNTTGVYIVKVGCVTKRVIIND